MYHTSQFWAENLEPLLGLLISPITTCKLVVKRTTDRVQYMQLHL